MSSEQVTAVTTNLQTAGQSILGDFISILPAVATIIGVLFVMSFVTYWLKKLRKAR